ncbi:MAG: DUF4258 domain-containing protein [Proteobacteria bacterium]|nr:DUF4258 domain-containing protein [Pseudomonadota bacterium]
MTWPDWWDWELELTSHLEKRIAQRGLSELELRAMLEKATSLEKDVVPGRWLVTGKRHHERWEVVVEPDEIDCIVVVVTAYRVL